MNRLLPNAIVELLNREDIPDISRAQQHSHCSCVCPGRCPTPGANDERPLSQIFESRWRRIVRTNLLLPSGQHH